MVQFGRYEQDGNAENGQEPIEWIVLDVNNGKVLLLSQNGLDSKCFDDNDTPRSISWDKSSLREWLNGDFYSSAFDEEEQKAIILNYVDNSYAQGNPVFKAMWVNNTQDRIYLLSYSELEKYIPDHEERTCMPGSRVLNTGESVDKEKEICRWWLRSPGRIESHSTYVDSDGSCYSIKARTMCAVRPVIWVDLAKLEAFRTNQIMGQLKF